MQVTNEGFLIVDNCGIPVANATTSSFLEKYFPYKELPIKELKDTLEFVPLMGNSADLFSNILLNYYVNKSPELSSFLNDFMVKKAGHFEIIAPYLRKNSEALSDGSLTLTSSNFKSIIGLENILSHLLNNKASLSDDSLVIYSSAFKEINGIGKIISYLLKNSDSVADNALNEFKKITYFESITSSLVKNGSALADNIILMSAGFMGANTYAQANLGLNFENVSFIRGNLSEINGSSFSVINYNDFELIPIKNLVKVANQDFINIIDDNVLLDSVKSSIGKVSDKLLSELLEQSSSNLLSSKIISYASVTPVFYYGHVHFMNSELPIGVEVKDLIIAEEISRKRTDALSTRDPSVRKGKMERLACIEKDYKKDGSFYALLENVSESERRHIADFNRIIEYIMPTQVKLLEKDINHNLNYYSIIKLTDSNLDYYVVENNLNFKGHHNRFGVVLKALKGDGVKVYDFMTKIMFNLNEQLKYVSSNPKLIANNNEINMTMLITPVNKLLKGLNLY